MFFAHGEHSLASVTMRSHVALDRTLRVHSFALDGAPYDSLCHGAATGPARQYPALWLILRGALCWSGPSSGAVRAPSFVYMREDICEGCEGRRAYRFRSSVSSRVVKLVSRPPLMPAPLPPIPRSGPLASEVVSALEQYAALSLPSSGPPRVRTEDVRALVVSLANERLLTAHAEGALVLAEDPRHEAVWAAVAAAYATIDTSASLKSLSAAAAISLRTFTRSITLFTQDLLLAPGSYRDAVTRYRMSLAAVLLARPENSIADVARRVGYAHAPAMANAFQRAGLPPPSAIRALTRSAEDELAAPAEL